MLPLLDKKGAFVLRSSLSQMTLTLFYLQLGNLPRHLRKTAHILREIQNADKNTQPSQTMVIPASSALLHLDDQMSKIERVALSGNSWSSENRRVSSLLEHDMLRQVRQDEALSPELRLIFPGRQGL